VALDENDGLCNAVLGYVLLERRQPEKATFHLERAIALNPNDSVIVIILAQVLAYIGLSDEALARTGEAFRLNPLAPQAYHATHGMVPYTAHRDAEAVAAFGRITTELEVWEYVYLVASYGQLGRPEEAEAQVYRCKALHPGVSLLKHAAQEPYKRPQDLDHLLDGLRKAGLND